MNKAVIGIAILGTASFLPIWRGGGHPRTEGVSFWQLLHDTTKSEYYPFGSPHIPYSEAVTRARKAYQNLYGEQLDDR